MKTENESPYPKMGKVENHKVDETLEMRKAKLLNYIKSNSALTIAEEFQKDCHKAMEDIQKAKPDVTYDAAKYRWMFLKLAELQEQISNLKNQQLP